MQTGLTFASLLRSTCSRLEMIEGGLRESKNTTDRVLDSTHRLESLVEVLRSGMSSFTKTLYKVLCGLTDKGQTS